MRRGHRSRLRATTAVAVLAVAALAGAARADEAGGTMTATLGSEAHNWAVAAGDSGWRPAEGMVALTIVGHAEPAAGTLVLELTVTEVEGDAARLFGAAVMLVRQDVTYVPGGEVPAYASAAGGTVSVTIMRFARDGDQILVAGRFTARLVRGDAAGGGGTVPVDGHFEVALPPLRQ